MKKDPPNIARDGASKNFKIADRHNGVTETFHQAFGLPTGTVIPNVGHPANELAADIHPSMASKAAPLVDDSEFATKVGGPQIYTQPEPVDGRGGVHKGARLHDKLDGKC